MFEDRGEAVIRKVLRGRFRMGRVRVPAWGAVTILSLAVAALAAGQAVGPVLSGSVTGSAGLTIEQTVTLDTDLALGSNPSVSGADDFVTTRNDEGTEFTIAAELNVGQTIYVCLYLQNDSGAGAAAALELNVPQGIDVELQEFSDSDNDSTNTCSASMDDDGVVEEAQFARANWLMTVGGSSVAASTAGDQDDDGVRITIEPKDDLKPGFYTLNGRIVQVSG